MQETKQIRPQAGYQTKFLSSSADIVIGGGAAGAGKTFGLLIEPLRHIGNRQFGATMFRRTTPQIRNKGGLWNESQEIYPLVGAKASESKLQWTFPSGATVKFSHLELEKDKFNYQGSQIPLICFDELTHFSEAQFYYMLSRNRSTSGVKPYIRCTCNPDPDSWVAKFISWWIDQETGFPIDERSGVVRFFVKNNGDIFWGDTKEDVIDLVPEVFNNPALSQSDPLDLIKSATFIGGKIYDNVKLLSKDPSYLANLLAQSEQDKSQLLDGNWKVKIDNTDLINSYLWEDVYSNSFVASGKPCITADIALHGSDNFVVGVWKGFRLIDIVVMAKSDASQVEEAIRTKAAQHSVPNSSIIYDSDGVGAFLRGYLKNAVPFNNNARPIEMSEDSNKFKNLKSQCAYLMAEKINQGDVYISPLVANQKHNGKNISEYINQEKKCLKRNKPDHDGKLSIIPKEQMKQIIGRSPDFIDMMLMRFYLELSQRNNGKIKNFTTINH